MQCRRQHRHSSSGELDVFGAARYFAGITEERADRLMAQLKTTTQQDKRMEGSFRGGHEPPLGLLHDDEHNPQLRLRGAKPAAAGKSKLIAFLGFMMSPSPESSFRKKPPLPPPPTTAAGDEPAKSSTSRESSSDASFAATGMQDFGHDDVDLGVVIGDRRLQGVRVVRGSGGEERWVVTCGAWEMESNDKMLDDDAATSIDRCHDQADDGEDGASHGNLESDCSSDLFDLDLEDRY